VQRDEAALSKQRAERDAVVVDARRGARQAKDACKAEKARSNELEEAQGLAAEELRYLEEVLETRAEYESAGEGEETPEDEEEEAEAAAVKPYRVRLSLKIRKGAPELRVRARVRPTRDVLAMVPAAEARVVAVATRCQASKATLKGLMATLKARTAEVEEAEGTFAAWVANEHAQATGALQSRRVTLQRQLKPLCAAVRNEYSTAQLQADFKAGLVDLCQGDDDDGGANEARPTSIYRLPPPSLPPYRLPPTAYRLPPTASLPTAHDRRIAPFIALRQAAASAAAATALPADFAMPVHCISGVAAGTRTPVVCCCAAERPPFDSRLGQPTISSRWRGSSRRYVTVCCLRQRESGSMTH